MAKYTTRTSSSKTKLYLANLIISPCIIITKFAYHSIHVSNSLHSLYCNLADGEYVLIPEQGAIHEEHEEPAPERAAEVTAENLPAAPAIEGKPRFYA